MSDTKTDLRDQGYAAVDRMMALNPESFTGNRDYVRHLLASLWFAGNSAGCKSVLDIMDSKPAGATLKGVYGTMCRDPALCTPKGYCPRDPTCAD